MHHPVNIIHLFPIFNKQDPLFCFDIRTRSHQVSQYGKVAAHQIAFYITLPVELICRLR